MNVREGMIWTLVTGAGLLGVSLVAASLWLLLGSLGDEWGAEVTQIVAICGGVGVLIAQFLLVNLLALGSLSVKMGEDAPS